MKKITKTLIIVFITVLPYLAEASSVDKARELMKLMEIRKNIDASQAQAQQMVSQMVAAQGLSKAEAEKAAKLTSKSMQSSFDAMKAMDWEGMFAEVYGSVFTEDELQGLIDFYKSPVGKKFLAKQPELTAATMQRMQVEMMKIMPEIQSSVMKAVEEAKK